MQRLEMKWRLDSPFTRDEKQVAFQLMLRTRIQRTMRTACPVVPES